MILIGRCDCYQCRKKRERENNRKLAIKKHGLIHCHGRWWNHNGKQDNGAECYARKDAWEAIGMTHVTASYLAHFWDSEPKDFQKLTGEDLKDVGFGPGPIKQFLSMPKNAQEIWESVYYKTQERPDENDNNDNETEFEDLGDEDDDAPNPL
jgi:hypothetical protein